MVRDGTFHEILTEPENIVIEFEVTTFDHALESFDAQTGLIIIYYYYFYLGYIYRYTPPRRYAPAEYWLQKIAGR